MFSTHYPEILAKLDQLDPKAYGRTRNFVDGKVSRLSPYISRGVISTRQVMLKIAGMGYSLSSVEKFIQELAWRDYWQQVWLDKGDLINHDLKHAQEGVRNRKIPNSLVEEETGIEAVDEAIRELYQTGYMHNHLRMYVASIACNLGRSHWKLPAQWMYYHLLDGDWASNALSWQWVAGSNANKKYFANQDNVNKYCHTDQNNTFLSVSYEQLASMEVPEELSDLASPSLDVKLPDFEDLSLDPELPVLLYTPYHLDPLWRKEMKANRILILDPEILSAYPMSERVIRFILELAKNIEGIQVYAGTFQQLNKNYPNDYYSREHPLTAHYEAEMDEREWMSSVEGYFPSFFGFWKKCRREIKPFFQS